ncbi:BcsE family c-di-GMP-binding protein, partial [Salmonella enterica]|uniref:BcsE family c-di-GMP-binding protein n=1 Tax=Salmonella enterica TaxID=28901 RepID=UPI00398C2573
VFFSFCRFHVLYTAFTLIFPFPTGDFFSYRLVWFDAKPLSAELGQLRLLSPELWGTPLPLATRADPVINAEHDGGNCRLLRDPLRLLDDPVELALC